MEPGRSGECDRVAVSHGVLTSTRAAPPSWISTRCQVDCWAHWISREWRRDESESSGLLMPDRIASSWWPGAGAGGGAAGEVTDGAIAVVADESRGAGDFDAVSTNSGSRGRVSGPLIEV